MFRTFVPSISGHASYNYASTGSLKYCSVRPLIKGPVSCSETSVTSY